MKKTDKNIIILTALGIICLILWTLSSYNNSKNETEELKTQEIQNSIELYNEEIKERTLEKENKEKRDLPSIKPSALNRKNNSDDNFVIIDLRTEELFNAGHIRGSTHHSLVDFTNTTRSITLVTQNGIDNRVLEIFDQYESQLDLTYLKDGIRGWKKVGLPLISLENEPSFTTNSKINYVEPRDLNEVITKNPSDQIYILDTRRSGNFKKGHISGAHNIPLTEIEKRYKEIPKNKDIYVYGADADASFQSGIVLFDLQHLNTKTIEGGFAAWKEFDYPISQ